MDEHEGRSVGAGVELMEYQFFNYQNVRVFLEDACTHYAKTAPALSDWLDELYVTLAEDPVKVTVFEVLQLQQLFMDGEWEHPNYAQNRWYKVREALGKERGVISF